MIRLKIHDSDAARLRTLMMTLCEALCGSPAYIESEILVSDVKSEPTDPEPYFYLVVGNDNDDDIEIKVHPDSLDISKVIREPEKA